jgi:hypothetical protein
MIEPKGPQFPRSEAGKAFALEKRDLTAKESEAERLASHAATTARLRKLRLAKEAAEQAAAPKPKPAPKPAPKPKRRP